MGLDLAIPFGVLIFMVVYLMYSRNTFEKKMLTFYEEKFENWKTHQIHDEVVKEDVKEFVGVVYKEKGRTTIEVFDEKYVGAIEAKKFIIKAK